MPRKQKKIYIATYIQGWECAYGYTRFHGPVCLFGKPWSTKGQSGPQTKTSPDSDPYGPQRNKNAVGVQRPSPTQEQQTNQRLVLGSGERRRGRPPPGLRRLRPSAGDNGHITVVLPRPQPFKAPSPRAPPPPSPPPLGSLPLSHAVSLSSRLRFPSDARAPPPPLSSPPLPSHQGKAH